MCALMAGRRKRHVLVLDHAVKIGGKILISGGGRCNFTNLHANSENYLSQNSSFSMQALARFKPQDFIALVKEHGISFHEKKLGQLFCDNSARDIVKMLVKECERSRVQFETNCQIQKVEKLSESHFQVRTERGVFDAKALVVATGGLSFPKLGASPLGFQIAKSFGLRVVDPAPALDGFIFTDPKMQKFCELSGLSMDCIMSCNGMSFRENMLFTHLGISGPAALQASLYWRPGSSLTINLFPDLPFEDWMRHQVQSNSQRSLKKALACRFPARFAQLFCEELLSGLDVPLWQLTADNIEFIGSLVQGWTLKPSNTVGYRKAEVTRGGVDTEELCPKSLESLKVPGLFFIGEVVDVTGWLGGYNFQWAWSSGFCAAQSL